MNSQFDEAIEEVLQGGKRLEGFVPEIIVGLRAEYDKQITSKLSTAAQQVEQVEPQASPGAGQPDEAEQTHVLELPMASNLVIPTFATPLFNALLRKLEKTVDESIIGSLGGLCLYGDLQNKPPAVSAAQPDHNPTTPYDISMRV